MFAVSVGVGFFSFWFLIEFLLLVDLRPLSLI